MTKDKVEALNKLYGQSSRFLQPKDLQELLAQVK